MTNFGDQFNNPLPEDPDEISRGIDEVIGKSIRYVPENKPEEEQKNGGGLLEEERERVFPEPFSDLEGDSPAQKEFNRIMRESQGAGREEQGEPIEDKRYSQVANTEENVREIVDPDFSNGRMLSSEVIIFWPTMSEKNFLSLGPKGLEAFIHPMPYYRQDFEERRDAFLSANDNKEFLSYYGENAYKNMVNFQNSYVRRIMELSDPNQVRKYDKLVDEFNAERERIVKERDYATLQKYIVRVRALVRETK